MEQLEQEGHYTEPIGRQNLDEATSLAEALNGPVRVETFNERAGIAPMDLTKDSSQL